MAGLTVWSIVYGRKILIPLVIICSIGLGCFISTVLPVRLLSSLCHSALRWATILPQLRLWLRVYAMFLSALRDGHNLGMSRQARDAGGMSIRDWLW